MFDITEGAREISAELEAVDVVCSDEEKAVEVISRIADDVLDWWQDPKRQKAVAAFCQTFARSGDSVEEWAKLMRLAMVEAKQEA